MSTAPVSGIVPPHDSATEEGVLVTLLTWPESYIQIADILTPDMFYRANYGAVYAACGEVAKRGERIDWFTVRAQLRRAGRADLTDGDLYVQLSSGMAAVATLPGLPVYAGQLLNLWRLRKAWEASSALQAAALTPGAESDTILAEASATILALAGMGPNKGAVSISDILQNVVSDAINGTLGITPTVGSGIEDLDRKLCGGFRPGDFVLIGARPSVGKSSLAIQMYVNALVAGKGALFFSMEVPEEQMARNILSQTSRVPLDLFRQGGKLKREHWQSVKDALTKLHGAKGWVVDRAHQTPASVRAQVERAVAENGCEIVFIDYLQEMYADGSRGRNWTRLQEIADISRALKVMARDLKIPVVALAQLNRATLQNANQRPHLANLRECGSLEQDADIVLLLHKAELFDNDGRPVRHDMDAVTIIIAKQRNGPLADIETMFRGECLRFELAATDAQQVPPARVVQANDDWAT